MTASASPSPSPSPTLRGALLVAGTTSDAGKSLLTAGICRLLARQGVRVAPFKAQNMALNSAVTADGAEIGRAQAMQADACGIPAEAAMNPVLLKPTGRRTSQVVVRGVARATTDWDGYRRMAPDLRPVILDALAELRARFDVVVCEGAGGAAEINLRRHDLVNLGLARAAGLPVIVVGDIERGGVFAQLHGTLALLDPDDQAHVAGFVVNRFRGDQTILDPGTADLQRRTGRPTLGVLPWTDGLDLDAEDSLALDRFDRAATAPDPLRVAVVRLGRISNVTDLDALRTEPQVELTLTRDPERLRAADLVVLPGTKATVDDLRELRRDGLDRVLVARATAGDPILGVCGGYQMLGDEIRDPGIETGHGTVPGLGLLPVTTVMHGDKVTRRVHGSATDGSHHAAGGSAGGARHPDHGAWTPEREAGGWRMDVDRGAWPGPVTGPSSASSSDVDEHPLGPAGSTATGYEIRHGRVRRHGAEPLLVREGSATPDGVVRGSVGTAGADDPADEGCRRGAVLGTSWHGLLEGDDVRHALLRWVAARRGREFRPSDARFAELRARRLDVLGDLVEEHLDTAALCAIIAGGVPTGLPTVRTVLDPAR
ncbi:MAG: cobyric acid synthase [Solirubrobacteraceae bacterium]|nr:cobyric acid synthase [Solirubrobacteraceae bacterium]